LAEQIDLRFAGNLSLEQQGVLDGRRSIGLENSRDGEGERSTADAETIKDADRPTD
jgi:hypothetical protein